MVRKEKNWPKKIINAKSIIPCSTGAMKNKLIFPHREPHDVG